MLGLGGGSPVNKRLSLDLINKILKFITRTHYSLNVHLFECGLYLKHYQRLITEALETPGYILHLGSGDGTSLNRPGELSSPRSRFVSVDVDWLGIVGNPGRLRVIADAAMLPFKDGCFTAVCSEHLLEHLPRPLEVFRDSRRVLRNGGQFIFATPNGWSYIALLDRMVPLEFRAAFVSFGRDAGEQQRHFPTYYRANSVFSIRRLAKLSGLAVKSLEGFVGEPCYTLALPVVHLLMIALHKMLGIFRLHRVAGITLVGLLVKRT